MNTSVDIDALDRENQRFVNGAKLWQRSARDDTSMHLQVTSKSTNSVPPPIVKPIYNYVQILPV